MLHVTVLSLTLSLSIFLSVSHSFSLSLTLSLSLSILFVFTCTHSQNTSQLLDVTPSTDEIDHCKYVIFEPEVCVQLLLAMLYGQSMLSFFSRCVRTSITSFTSSLEGGTLPPTRVMRYCSQTQCSSVDPMLSNRSVSTEM